MRKWIVAGGAVAVATAGVLAWALLGPGGGGTALRFVTTSRFTGTFEPMAQGSEKLGGLARCVAVMKTLRAPNAFFVDTGDFSLPGHPRARSYQVAVTRGVLAAMEAGGVEAANIGYYDQLLGRKALLELSQSIDFPLFSASLVDPGTGEYVFAPFVVLEKAGMRVAFVGIINDAPLTDFAREKMILTLKDISAEELKRIEEVTPEGEGLKILPPGEAVARVTPLIEGKADAAVLVADGDTAWMLLARYGDGRVYKAGLGTAVYPPAAKPLMQGKVPVFLGSSAGRHVGVADVRFKPGKPPKVSAWRPAPVTMDIAPDAEATEAIRGARRALGEIDPMLLMERNPPGKISYVGSQACAQCHRDEYGIWSASPHAHALDSLKREDAHFDPPCLVCHVTDVTSSNGYHSEAATPELAAVSCESCHDRGADHVQLGGKVVDGKGRLLKPLPTVCVRCHTEAQSPDFDYRKYWPKIRHGKGLRPEEPSGATAHEAGMKEGASK